MKLFDETLTRVERSLDVRLQRHEVLAGNIANIDTPGFRPRDVDWLTAMGAAMEGGGDMARTDGSHMNVDGSTGAGGPARIIDALGTTPSIDGNMVDLDRTMASLAENAMQYNAATKAATKKLGILRYAASDGNG